MNIQNIQPLSKMIHNLNKLLSFIHLWYFIMIFFVNSLSSSHGAFELFFYVLGYKIISFSTPLFFLSSTLLKPYNFNAHETLNNEPMSSIICHDSNLGASPTPKKDNKVSFLRWRNLDVVTLTLGQD